MYLIVIAWIYVVLMMSVAEATNATGTVLGAVVTFVLYGLLPTALVAYLMSTPARNRAIKKRAADERAAHVAGLQGAQAAPETGTNPASGLPSDSPDAGGHPAGGSEAVPGAASPDGSVAPVGKEP